MFNDIQAYSTGIILFLSLNKYIGLSVKERQLLSNDTSKFRDSLQLSFIQVPSTSSNKANVKDLAEASVSIDTADDASSISTVNEVLTSVVTPSFKNTLTLLQKVKDNYFLQAKLDSKLIHMEKEIDSSVAIGTFHRRHTVSLKQLPVDVLQNSKLKQAIQQEILLLKYLGNYPTILSCYGYVVNGPSIQIVYELAPYGSLDKVLRENKVQSFPLSLMVAWMSDLADAMQFLHSKGIIHGDIKAENVLVFERLETKLCNFQSAKACNQTIYCPSPRSGALSQKKTISLTANEGAVLEPNMILQNQDDVDIDMYSFVQYALVVLSVSDFVLPPDLSLKDQVKYITKLLSKRTESAALIQSLEELLNNSATNRINSEELANTLQQHLDTSCHGDPRSFAHPEFRDVQIVESLLPSINANLETTLLHLSLSERTSKIATKGYSPSVSGIVSVCSSSTSSTASSVLSLDFLRYSIDQSLQEAEDRFKLAEYLREKIHLTNASAIETAKIFMRNGIYTVRHLQSKLLKASNKSKAKAILASPISPKNQLDSPADFSGPPTWEILIDLGIDPDIALDIYEYFHVLNGKIPLMPPSSAGLLSRSSSSDGTKCVLPSEIARLYALASQSSRKSALEKLETLAMDMSSAYNFFLANGFLMRMYLLGQGNLQKDRKKAEEIAGIVLPWLQERILVDYEVARMYIQYLLGVCYSGGLADLPCDDRESFKWYKASADEGTTGYSAAQAYVGYCYFHGLGVKKDLESAFKYYLRAAEQGYAGAQCNVGMCYERSYGLPKKDMNEALKWFRLAADQGDAAGLFNVAYYYEKGAGDVTQSWTKAFEFYLKSAERNHKVAQYNVGKCLYDGNGVEQNYEEARKWFQKSSAQDYPPALCKLGLCYEQGLGGLDQDYQKAVEYYQKSADYGDISASYYLGFCYFNGWGVEVNHRQAVYYYQISANKNHPPALNNLGYCHFHGLGVNKNLLLAARYYRQSADLGYAPAQFNLGYCFERGLGVDKRLNMVIRYYRLAAEQGNQHAKQALLKYFP